MKYDELERIWKDAVVAQSKYCQHLPRETKTTQKYFSQGSQFPGLRTSRPPPKYKSRGPRLGQTYAQFNALYCWANLHSYSSELA
jgi:hypothetical protein